MQRYLLPTPLLFDEVTVMMQSPSESRMVLLLVVISFPAPLAAAQRQMERLDRGVVAIHDQPGQAFISWRLLGSDPPDVAFHVYRQSEGAPAQRLTEQPLTEGTHYRDPDVDLAHAQSYFVRPVADDTEGEPSKRFTLPVGMPVRPYLSVPLQTPAGYRPNDGSVGDLTGDGRYEIVVKMERRTRDNSQRGITDPTYLHAYTLDGELLWRIDLGQNIRSGAHYTQFLVYDFDGDGRSELVCKTADGTVDGRGDVMGDAEADWRNDEGRILAGPEYLTVFEGHTGAALTTADYLPPRHPETDSPSERQLDQLWGDGYGNRVDRFLAGVAYLDGERPSIVMTRGYYERTVLVAWDLRDGQLTHRWTFDSHDGTPGNLAYAGQGNHSLAVADVTGNGKDDIIFGAMAIAHDGTGLYSTGWGHGDALHVSQMDPEDSRLMAFMPHETPRLYGANGISLRDAATGELIWGVSGRGDVGRGVAMDIDPRYVGYEIWALNNRGLYNVRHSTSDSEHGPRGVPVADSRPRSINFGVWWTGDLLREILDRNFINKWDWEGEREVRLLTATGCQSNNGSKATPVLSGDILGDWREEVVWRTEDNQELRIYTTPHPTPHRIPTLMHDPVYRQSIAWQNVGYNQPPHPGFFLGHDMPEPPRPSIRTVPPRSR